MTKSTCPGSHFADCWMEFAKQPGHINCDKTTGAVSVSVSVLPLAGAGQKATVRDEIELINLKMEGHLGREQW